MGPKLRQALLRKLGSVERIRQAGRSEIMAVKGIGPSLARRIHAFLRQAARRG